MSFAVSLSEEEKKRLRRERYLRWKAKRNPEAVKAMQREANRRYRAAHPDRKPVVDKEKQREYQRKSYEKNREKQLADQKRWRDANPDYQMEWRRRNPKAAKKIQDKSNRRYKETGGLQRWQDANREKLRQQARDRDARNPDDAKARQKRWRERHPEKVIAANAAYRAANPEKHLAAVRAWHEAHPEQRAIWKAENPEAGRIYAQNRRNLIRSGRLSRGIVKRLMTMQAGHCAHENCRADLAEVGYHLDHVMPLSRGGAHEDDNMQLLCPTCNLRKGAKLPVEFHAEMA